MAAVRTARYRAVRQSLDDMAETLAQTGAVGQSDGDRHVNYVRNLAILGALAVGVVASAQTQAPVSYTVGIWPSTATDPNLSAPLSTALYPLSAVTCGEPRQLSLPTIINPDEGRFDDPANATLDCVVAIRTQILTVPPGTYKVALRVNGATESSLYGPWGDVFERRGPPPVPGPPRVR